MAEKPKPEFPVPVAVTRHLEMFLTFALLHLGQHVVLSLPMRERCRIHQCRAGFA